MKMRWVFLVVLALVSFALTPAAFARRGADDGPGDGRGGHGADDGAPSGDDGGISGGGGSGGGSGGGDQNRLRVRVRMTRAAGASDGDVDGHIEVRAENGRERLKIEADHLTPGATVAATIGDGLGGTLALGTRVADATGHGEWEFDTQEGPGLPGGATSVADLAGRAVAVLDDAGDPLLAGVVPSTTGAEAAQIRLRVRITGEVRLQLRLMSSFGPGARLWIDLRGLTAGETYTMSVEDPAGSQSFVASEDFTADSHGRFRLRRVVASGETVFAGLTAAQLGGRRFELRDGEGNLVLQGSIAGG